jgi:hypothetical protein
MTSYTAAAAAARELLLLLLLGHVGAPDLSLQEHRKHQQAATQHLDCQSAVQSLRQPAAAAAVVQLLCQLQCC